MVIDKAPEKTAELVKDQPLISTPVTLSMSSLHKNTALGVDRKSVTSKTLPQLITMIKPSRHAPYKYSITQKLWYDCDQKLTHVSLSDDLFSETTQQPTTTMAPTTITITTTTTSNTTQISTTMAESNNDSPSSEYDLSGKKRFTGSHVFSHMSALVSFCSSKLPCHIINMHDRHSKNVVKVYSLFSYLTFFSRPWNKVGDVYDKGFYSLVPDEAHKSKGFFKTQESL